MKRRYFFKTLGFLSGGLALTKVNKSRAALPLEESLSTVSPLSKKYWEFVRDQFLLPKDYAYLNTGGIGASPISVLDFTHQVTEKLELKPRPGHGYEEWFTIKEKCADLLGGNIDFKNEIHFTACTTEGNNIIINGLPLKKGDEIITTTHEHSGLIVPLLNKVHRFGVKIKTFHPDMKNGLGNVDRIEKLINKKTKLIFVSHITCTTGQRLPAKEISELGRSRNVWVAFDGAQVAGNLPLDLKDIDCDFYATGGHKWVLGPKRTGFSYVRKELLDVMLPTTVGAYSDGGHDIETGEFKYNPSAERYEWATQNEALYQGMGRAIDFLNTIGMENVWQHNKNLAEMFYQGLSKIKNVEILSHEQEEYRTPLITFRVKDKNFKEIGSSLVEKDLRVRVVTEANLNGIRVSCHIYNSEEEIERLLSEINKIATNKI